MSPTGSALIYSTYIGGTKGAFVSDIKADSEGYAYITGSTESVDFPVTDGAIQATHAGNTDAFVTKLNPTGTDIIYSTYLGTSGWQGGAGIALAPSGEVYVAGNTSYGFPTTPGAFRTEYGIHFVTKLNANGTAVVYSSCFSLNRAFEDFDGVFGIAIDSAGNAYVTGIFSDFSYSPPFVLKLNSTGSAPVYIVSLGGSGIGYDMSVDPFGNAYVTGFTYGNLTVTSDAIQIAPGGGTCFNYACSDAFLTKLGLQEKSFTRLISVAICVTGEARLRSTPQAAFW